MIRSIHDFLTFVFRILTLYAIWMLCRIVFYLYNIDLTGSISWTEFPALLKGALIFDSASIFYINLPFLFFSLIPFRFRERKGYQVFLMWLFVIVNSLGLIINLSDIFYYPYKLGRIASDDFHFLTNGNFGLLLLGFMKDYWYGFLAWIGLGALLWFLFKKIKYRPTVIKRRSVYYLSQTVILALSAVFAIVMIRGGNMSKATYPINISDAGLYASPSKAGLVLSNPFCVIRTSSSRFSYPEYFSEEELNNILSPAHYPQPDDSTRFRLEGRPNVMLIILESFSSSHIRELSDQFAEEDPSYTPFLDSLIREGYIFRNAYHNGNRSLDALPSLWASIPTFKKLFLAMPQSMAPYHALPECMKDMGYTTAFMHGAVRESMSFQAFGKTVGVERFWSQEDYEAEHGKNDFDGKWGIWDDKFFPFVGEKMNTLPPPFFATFFTLSSHHPFQLPDGFEGRYPEGTLPNHRMYGYSDEALRNLFEQMSQNEWFDNTVFVITADHGYGADNEKYRKIPYSFGVPLLFYSPGGLIPQGSDERTAGHIDLMPTLLGALNYDKPYFAFGNDLFADPLPKHTINYMGAFNIISDSLVYIFNEHDFIEVYNYRNDPSQEHNLVSDFAEDDGSMRWGKAFIQQYYTHVKNRKYTVE